MLKLCIYVCGVCCVPKSRSAYSLFCIILPVFNFISFYFFFFFLILIRPIVIVWRVELWIGISIVSWWHTFPIRIVKTVQWNVFSSSILFDRRKNSRKTKATTKKLPFRNVNSNYQFSYWMKQRKKWREEEKSCFFALKKMNLYCIRSYFPFFVLNTHN